MTRIALINYLNATPFLYGIRKHGLHTDPRFEFQYLNPAACAQALLTGAADIGLVPVAVLPELGNFEIIGDSCIGSTGKVDSVLLVSNQPLEKISKVHLDYQSKTSAALCKILMRDFWKKDIDFLDADENYLSQVKHGEAALVIGDRAFDATMQFNYTYDLAEAWAEFTGLPFVFAVWIAKTSTNQLIIKTLNDAVTWGIENRDMAISEIETQHPSYYSIRKYLTHSISYKLDDAKRKGMETFLSMLNK